MNQPLNIQDQNYLQKIKKYIESPQGISRHYLFVLESDLRRVNTPEADILHTKVVDELKRRAANYTAKKKKFFLRYIIDYFK